MGGAGMMAGLLGGYTSSMLVDQERKIKQRKVAA